MAVVAVAVDEGDVIEESEVLLRVLQPFVEIEADDFIGYVVTTRQSVGLSACVILLFRTNLNVCLFVERAASTPCHSAPTSSASQAVNDIPSTFRIAQTICGGGTWQVMSL